MLETRSYPDSSKPSLATVKAALAGVTIQSEAAKPQGQTPAAMAERDSKGALDGLRERRSVLRAEIDRRNHIDQPIGAQLSLRYHLLNGVVGLLDRQQKAGFDRAQMATIAFGPDGKQVQAAGWDLGKLEFTRGNASRGTVFADGTIALNYKDFAPVPDGDDEHAGMHNRFVTGTPEEIADHLLKSSNPDVGRVMAHMMDTIR